MKKECNLTRNLAIPITVSILLTFFTQLCFSQSFRILVLQKEKFFPDFGPYLGEILRAEGIVDFELKRFSEISLDQLSNYKVLIMSPGRWENGNLVAVRKYVEAGGNLMVFLPEKETSSFLRLKVTKSKSSEGYIHFNLNDLQR